MGSQYFKKRLNVIIDRIWCLAVSPPIDIHLVMQNKLCHCFIFSLHWLSVPKSVKVAMSVKRRRGKLTHLFTLFVFASYSHWKRSCVKLIQYKKIPNREKSRKMFIYGSLWTTVLCIVGELVGGGSVAVTVVVSDMW